MDSVPRKHEIELSLFGPGYGECILMHAGDDAWIIVDSCIDPETNEPSGSRYLHNIGVDPQKSVKLIVATHWHDDHIRGLGSVLEQCRGADFVCPGALLRKEFITLVKAHGGRSTLTDGISEFSKIITILEKRKQKPILAIADRLIWKKSLYNSQLASKIYSLSPSDASLEYAYMDIARLLPKSGHPKKDILSLQPNHVAVALWVHIGGKSILLGSDLQNTPYPGTGWQAIVNSSKTAEGRAEVFKVPHHGSENGDHPMVWKTLLNDRPIAILTPFKRGKILVPTKADARRIWEKTNQAYITAFPSVKRLKKQKVVADFVKASTRGIHQSHGSFGHIRLRTFPLKEHHEWRIELFGSAMPLHRMVA